MASLLDRQRAAFLCDGPPDLRARRAALARLRAAVLSNRAALVEAISADFGHRAAPETDLLEIVPTLQAIDYLRHRLARFMRPERRHVAATYRLGQARVVHQPKGVIGIMAPWNYPFSLTMIPLATALAAGNRAMLKPSEHTPRTTAAIEALCGTTFAAEEVAVVSGDARIGAAFSGLAFDHLLFTGSTSVGRHVMRAASENLVPVTLELGGKSPVVVAPGAVDDRTVAAIAYASSPMVARPASPPTTRWCTRTRSTPSPPATMRRCAGCIRPGRTPMTTPRSSTTRISPVSRVWPTRRGAAAHG